MSKYYFKIKILKNILGMNEAVFNRQIEDLMNSATHIGGYISSLLRDCYSIYLRHTMLLSIYLT